MELTEEQKQKVISEYYKATEFTDYTKSEIYQLGMFHLLVALGIEISEIKEPS